MTHLSVVLLRDRLQEYQTAETVPVKCCDPTGVGKYWAAGKILWTSPRAVVMMYFCARCDCSAAAL